MTTRRLLAVTATSLLLGCGQTLVYTDTTPDESPQGSDTGAASEDSETDLETDTDTDTDTQVAEEEDSEMLSWSPPSDLDCGEVVSTEILVRNTGTTTWSHDDGYKLGAMSDSDPFYSADTRVWLPEGTTVPPGSTWRFEFELTAPESEGRYTSDWQMVHEHVRWFGDSVSTEIVVECPQPTGGWVAEACARNGSEICDDEAFRVEPGTRYGLLCNEAEGGISFIASNTGPEMSDGMERCQGWEERGQDAWDHLDYVAQTECHNVGDVVEVDLSRWVGDDLWFGSHDHPDGGGHMTSTCLAIYEE